MPRTPSFWRRRGPVAVALLPLAALFGAVAALRRALYRSRLLESGHVGVPVIIVGNLVVGGGGKTPLVVEIVRALRERGFRPGVVARGYGGSATDAMLVEPDSDPGVAGDEPLLVRQRSGVPVAVGRDRIAAARRLLVAYPGIDVIVSDDGMQHYRLHRALELCVLGEGGVGNGWLLPAGPLREPRSRLAAVDAVLHVGDAPQIEAPAWGVTRRLGRAWRLVHPGERMALESLRDRRWVATCGIARPDGFFDALETAGLEFERRTFPDHHNFVPGDLPADAAVLMTEKDAVKCREFAGRDWWAVELDATIEPGFVDWLVERLRT